MSSLDTSVSEILVGFCLEVSTPRALSICICLRYGDMAALQSLRTVPSHYMGPLDFKLDNLLTDFLRKWQADNASQRLKLAAQERLFITEAQCAITNLRFLRHITGENFSHPDDLRVHEFLVGVKKRIARILGPIPTTLTGGRFGPGATLTNPGNRSTIPDKLESVPTGTASALRLFDTLFGECAWVRYSHNSWSPQDQRSTVRASRFFTVPKNADYDRGACLSPNVNGFLQLAVGDYIRRRLRGVGIHIKAGDGSKVITPDLHRQIAKESSLTGSYATIDLQDASNTISKNLITFLLGDWAPLLTDLREHSVELLDGRILRLEMFSAMGNGYTFELETLVFFALCKEVVGDGFVSVFGDDIIVPADMAGDVIAVLRYCGFTTNTQKTFVSGRFRESCGGDFFDGVPVRGFFLKANPTTPSDWITMANGFRRSIGEELFPRFKNVWKKILQQIPVPVRNCRGPSALGDILIHDPAWRPYIVKHSIRYYQAYCPITPVLEWHHWSAQIVLASALYGASDTGVSPRLTKHSKLRYRITEVCYS